MNHFIVSAMAVITAMLVVVSAGCVTPTTGNSAAPVTPVVTGEKPLSGIPALPDGLSAANLLVTATPEGVAANPGAARKGDTVSIYYTGTFENGTVFDSNMDKKPVEFTLGNSTVIDGIDEAVTGMTADQEKTVDIPAKKAYGEYDTGLIRTVNRTGPIANTSFVVGKYFSIHDRETDSYSFVRILDVTPTTVTWDGNNPLAGMNFTFTIKLVKIIRP
jgi:peptidylprolyl isomerase